MLLRSTGGVGHLNWIEVEFTPTAGQITFLLGSIPADVVSLEFYVNGVLYDDTTDYTVSGSTVTWTNVAFILKTEDKVIIRFQ